MSTFRGLHHALNNLNLDRQTRVAPSHRQDVGVASDSDEDWDAVHEHDLPPQENFHKVARHEVDPLSNFPLDFVLPKFHELSAKLTSDERMGSDPEKVIKLISARYLPSFHQQHSVKVPAADIYRAFLYWTSDSGRVRCDVWARYVEYAQNTSQLPTPRWSSPNEYRFNFPERWSCLVQAIEFFRLSEPPRILANPSVGKVHVCAEFGCFRLHDGLDPINFLVLQRAFEAARRSVSPASTHIGVKEELVKQVEHFAGEYRRSVLPPSHKYKRRSADDLDGDSESEDAKPTFVPLLRLPLRSALYEGYLLYTLGPSDKQRAAWSTDTPQGKPNKEWLNFGRGVFGLPPNGQHGGLAAATAATASKELTVYSSMSWADWKLAVFARMDNGEMQPDKQEDSEDDDDYIALVDQPDAGLALAVAVATVVE
ncbi:hypothetical protein JCM10213_008166 [Rhodosporidiobolus nylandii]